MDIEVDNSADRWDEYINAHDVDTRRQVGRVFNSFTELKNSLRPWYEKDRIKGWRKSGIALEQPDGSWWSGISPLTQVCRLKPHTDECVSHIHTCLPLHAVPLSSLCSCGRKQTPMARGWRGEIPRTGFCGWDKFRLSPRQHKRHGEHGAARSCGKLPKSSPLHPQLAQRRVRRSDRRRVSTAGDQAGDRSSLAHRANGTLK